MSLCFINYSSLLCVYTLPIAFTRSLAISFHATLCFLQLIFKWSIIRLNFLKVVSIYILLAIQYLFYFAITINTYFTCYQLQYLFYFTCYQLQYLLFNIYFIQFCSIVYQLPVYKHTHLFVFVQHHQSAFYFWFLQSID